MDEEHEIDLELMDYENMAEGMDKLIDVVSRFKSVDTMAEIDDDELIDMVNVLQVTLYTAIGILYSRGQFYEAGEDCEHTVEDD